MPLKLFFDRAWNSKDDHISYGHDIEGSWLLYEAAEVLNEPAMIAQVQPIITEMAQRVYAACPILNFITTYQIDRKHGEWFWMVTDDGRPYLDQPKVEPWKCPYHNSRACLEIIARLGRIMNTEGI